MRALIKPQSRGIAKIFMESCGSPKDTWEELHKIAFYDLVEMLEDVTLEELEATKLGCTCFDLSVLDFAVWGGARRTFKLLVQKGLRFDPTSWLKVDFWTCKPRELLTPDDELREWLLQGFVDIAPAWSVVRLLVIGERERTSAFGPVPKDVVKMIARILIVRVPIWAPAAPPAFDQ